MSTISERLREERKRLGLSQGEFAEAIGIHRNTQARYERGEREPDTAYLDAIRKAGVDVPYVIGPNTGERVGASISGEQRAALGLNNVIAAYADLIEKIGARVGSSPKAIARLAAFPHSYSPIFWDGRSVPGPVIDEFFEGCNLEVDCQLLTLILGGVEGVLSDHELSMSSVKKAQAVAMLYRSFKVSGKVDVAMIEQAVKLAAG